MYNTKVSKACQECRRRKIRCDGMNPCATCQQRNTPCQFRERARVRVRKGGGNTTPCRTPDVSYADLEETDNRAVIGASPADLPPLPPGKDQPSHIYRDVHRSVSARDQSPSFGSVELFYGPTSDFSLLQHLYRGLYITPHSASHLDRDDTDEVNQGLDFFRIRHIFFGPTTPASLPDTPPPYRLPPRNVCYALMNRFLATHYNMVPFYLKSKYDQLLLALYDDPDDTQFSQVQKQIGLMAIAISASNTEHFEWGATIFQYCQAQRDKTEYTVSLECIQLGIMMISLALSMLSPLYTLSASYADCMIRYVSHGICEFKYRLYHDWQHLPEGLRRGNSPAAITRQLRRFSGNPRTAPHILVPVLYGNVRATQRPLPFFFLLFFIV